MYVFHVTTNLSIFHFYLMGQTLNIREGDKYPIRSLVVEQKSFSASSITSCLVSPVNFICKTFGPIYFISLIFIALWILHFYRKSKVIQKKSLFEIIGKKVSQSSMKISKNEKKQLNSLIKVLKPKVYITDSSNFKRLVQELTGNGTTITSSSSSSTKLPQAVEKAPVIDIEEQDQPHGGMEVSFDALSDSFELCNQAYYPEEPKQACNQIYLDEYSSLEQDQPHGGMEVSFDALSESFELYNQASCPEEPKQACNQIYLDGYSALEDISMNHQADLLAYRDLESWLLDVESYPCYNGCDQIEHGVSIYDYELSGLI